MIHSPYFATKYFLRKRKIAPKRYRHLLHAVYKTKAKRIMEVGVFNGNNSMKMIETAKTFYKPENITYYGFDLFEHLSDEELKEEFSKKPFSEAEIQKKLDKSKAEITLYKGYSQKTIPAFVDHYQGPKMDFIYIDGGHHIDTVTQDWQNLQPLIGDHTIVLFDDFYPYPTDELVQKGCNRLVQTLEHEDSWQVDFLEPVDRFDHDWGTLHVQFVEVRKSLG